MKHVRTTVLVAILMSVLTAQPAKADYGDELVMPWRFYRRLAQCETAANWKHSTRSYTSGFGIARGTWQRFSNSSSAKNKTPLQQARIVDNIAFLGFTEADGDYVWPVGPWGWGAIKRQNCMQLQGFICRSQHPAVQRWKRGC